MNIISACCKATIVQGTFPESPLGDRFTINYKQDICSECAQEADVIEVCDICGEPADKFTRIDGDDYCPVCFDEKLEGAIKEIKEGWGVA